ncbi:MAG: hypothetical protein L0212_01200 [Acidobacteria bacterium]|nr:hypothetical protein [Acidobacteriota bacterium]
MRFRHNPRDTLVVAMLATACSVAAFLFYWRQDALLLYGDAVAHLNIARRVVDSRTPGPLQLGSVWLPLPHLLMLPFVLSDWAWRTGAAGSLVSMVSYVAGVVAVFRLVRGWASRPAAWIAAVIHGANPNLIYLQTTAMTEALYLALFLWATVHFSEFAARLRGKDPAAGDAGKSLERCGALLAAAMFTRYDAWFASAFFVVAVIWCFVKHRNAGEGGGALRRSLRNFLLIVAAAPVLWMAYNWSVFGSPLEFATGPHSARAIAERTTKLGDPMHPGHNSPRVAAIYFLKAARLNLGEGDWQNVVFLMAVAGVALALTAEHRARTTLLLWLPVPFYSLSIAYGSIPVFLPAWWPFSYYNVRYGLQLLPAAAVFAALAVECALRVRMPAIGKLATTGAIAAAVGSYASVAYYGPICLREARVNSYTRVALERKLAAELVRLPESSTLAMHVGSHGGALQRAGIPLRRVIHEGNFRQWEWALASPEEAVDFMIALDGDEVAAAAAKKIGELERVATVESPDQPRAAIYRTRRAKSQITN